MTNGKESHNNQGHITAITQDPIQNEGDETLQRGIPKNLANSVHKYKYAHLIKRDHAGVFSMAKSA